MDLHTNEEIIEEEEEEEEDDEEDDDDKEEEEEEDILEDQYSEYNMIKKSKKIFDFFEYMDYFPYLDCGKVINHKTIDTEIHYLFQDNQDPPNLIWVPGSTDFSEDQVRAIQKYWLMFKCNDICGLPKRPQKQIKIVDIIPIQSEKHNRKITYEVKTPNLPVEFFNINDFHYGLEGRNTLSKPIRFFEYKIYKITEKKKKIPSQP